MSKNKGKPSRCQLVRDPEALLGDEEASEVLPPSGIRSSFPALPLAAATKSGCYHLAPKQSHSSPEQTVRPAGCRAQPHCHVGSAGTQRALLACPGLQEGPILNRDRMVPMEQLRQVLTTEGALSSVHAPLLVHPASQTPPLSACQRAANCL